MTSVAISTATLLVTALCGGHAEACSVVNTATESSTTHGEGCSVDHLDVSGKYWSHERLEPVRKLGTGMVVQEYVSGGGCIADHMAVITDCKTGRTLVVGTARNAYNGTTEDEVGYDRYVKFLDSLSGQVAKGTALLDLEPVAGWDERTEVPTKRMVRLSIGDAEPTHGYVLGCGCEISYPEQIGEWKKQWKN